MGAKGSTLLAGSARSNGGDMPLWAIEVFEYSNWEDRAHLMNLSKRWRRNTNDPNFFRFLCTRLSIEHGVYAPPVLPTSDTWKSLFSELYKLRELWDSEPADVNNPIQTATVGERFKISVYARFRPNLVGNQIPSKAAVAAKLEEDDEGKEVEVTLPLHQRLAMIKMSHNLKSNKQALKVLTSEGGWFQAKWTELEDKENKSDNEKSSSNVFYSKQTIPSIIVKKPEEKMVASVQSLDPVTGRVVMIAPDVGLREFNYDGVLPPHSSQKFMYDSVMRKLVTDFINGFNATAIVYGQTGSGKTYSMFGRDEASIYGKDVEGKGIVPRACEEIFLATEQRRREFGIHSELAVSYVEIYGDHVSDLLQFGARCGHSQVSSQRYVLNGAAEKRVHNMAELLELLKLGEAQKRRAATAMNERSSRAHSLFIVTLKQSRLELNNDVTLTSRLFLADLGGSEQVKKSQVEAGAERLGAAAHFSLGFEMGAHMREAVYINLGLLALKKCIESLNNRAGYTPYQDSKLTMLLSAGLGGNSKTSIVICNNMDPKHASETVATLRFGERCALIENEARNNASMLAAVLADIDAQIEALEAEILKKERWEVREEKRLDVNAEENTLEAAVGGFEIKKVAELVGAEAERQALEQLLIRRAKFTGSRPLDGSEDDLTGQSKRKHVVGFGKNSSLYGLGEKFDAAEEETRDNARFENQLKDVSALPAVVRAKGTKNWATADDLEKDQSKLERKAAKVKRNRLAYSGISA